MSVGRQSEPNAQRLSADRICVGFAHGRIGLNLALHFDQSKHQSIDHANKSAIYHGHERIAAIPWNRQLHPNQLPFGWSRFAATATVVNPARIGFALLIGITPDQPEGAKIRVVVTNSYHDLFAADRIVGNAQAMGTTRL